MNFRSALSASTLGLGVLLAATTTLAHHSGAMFDDQKMRSLSGTVREFQWHNPHCYIQLIVPSADGGPDEEWSLEMGAPMYLYNLGWRPSTLKPGDRIAVKVAPLSVAVLPFPDASKAEVPEVSSKR